MLWHEDRRNGRADRIAIEGRGAGEAVEEPLPPRIEEALGQLVGAAREGLLALGVGVGPGVLSEMMVEEVEDVCGPKGKHDPDRSAYHHGSDDGTVTLGGRRV